MPALMQKEPVFLIKTGPKLELRAIKGQTLIINGGDLQGHVGSLKTNQARKIPGVFGGAELSCLLNVQKNPQNSVVKYASNVPIIWLLAGK